MGWHMATTISHMAKKKLGGQHATPRTPVQVPTAWWAIARKLASKHKQPTLWYLLSIIATEAEKEGIEGVPPLPWEEDEPS